MEPTTNKWPVVGYRGDTGNEKGTFKLTNNMEKHSKEYAEKMASEYAVDLIYPYHSPIDDTAKEHFTEGYLKAIEETNAKELYEALESLVHECELEGWWDYDNDMEDAYITRAIEALNKAK